MSKDAGRMTTSDQNQNQDDDDDDDDEHKWQPGLIKQINLESTRLWFRSINFCLYVHDYDLYAIFKPEDQLRGLKISDTHSRRHEMTGIFGDQNYIKASCASSNCANLRMPHTIGDKFRRKITAPLRVFAYYNLIKWLMIALAQHTLMRYEHLVPKYRQSKPLISPEMAQFVANNLGMPYYDLKDISLAFITTTSCFLFVCIVALPLYHRRHPLNIAQMRFLLGPGHELRRVDECVRQRLVAINTSLEVYKHSKLATYSWQINRSACELTQQTSFRRQWRSYETKSWLANLANRELKYCDKIAKCLVEFNKTKLFRPSTFGPRAYLKLLGRAKLIVLGTLVTYTISCLVIGTCLLYTAYTSRRGLQLNCNLFNVFTWPELLVILETFVNIAITCASGLLNTTIFELLTLCQLDLINEIKSELTFCHGNMLEFLHVGKYRISEKRIRSGSESEMESESRGRQSCKLRDKLELSMLKSIVRLSIYDRELRDNARCISQQTVHPTCYLASAVFLAAINVQFKLPASGLGLRWFVVFLLWFIVNSVAVSCANIHARVLSIQRQLWSVLALSSRLVRAEDNYYVNYDCGARATRDQLAAPRGRNNQIDWGRLQSGLRCDGICCSFVTDLWHKFVISTSSNVEQHCSRLLNIKLSYQTIIEANFFSIFIYSLTLGHDK